jgi:hypothetical protein
LQDVAHTRAPRHVRAYGHVRLVSGAVGSSRCGSLTAPRSQFGEDKADAQLLRELLAAARIPECYIPPTPVLEWRALLELYHDLRMEHTGWAQRIHATCLHQGTTTLGEAGVIRGEGVEAMVGAPPQEDSQVGLGVQPGRNMSWTARWPGQVLLMLPSIFSASDARDAGAGKGSAKYCVSCTTCSSANSIMLTE